MNGGWAMWLNGAQRCVLFTDQPSLREEVLQPPVLERVQSEYEISLNCISVSLVNDFCKQEIMHLVIAR